MDIAIPHIIQTPSALPCGDYGLLGGLGGGEGGRVRMVGGLEARGRRRIG